MVPKRMSSCKPPGIPPELSLPTPSLMTSWEVRQRGTNLFLFFCDSPKITLEVPDSNFPGLLAALFVHWATAGAQKPLPSPSNFIFGVRNQPDLGSNPDQVGGTRFGKIHIFSPAAVFLIFPFEIAGQPCMI